MKETEKRIKQYKELLPHAREKVFAALLIFIISAVVMVSTTFAWLVLSRSPEVSGIATNIAANGNLEIALSGPEGEQPPDSMVGDSVKDILLRNLTWGNIINLADPSYGLGNIELRPASLNLENLLDKPLFGATYSKDGRVEKLNKDFAYSNYDSDNDLFVVSPANSPKYGVRAISSVMTTNIGGDRIYQAMLQLADDKNIEAGQNYLDIVGKKDYLDALVGVIGRYAQTKVGDSNPDCTEYVSTIYQMCLEFEKVFEESGEALLLLAQAQQFKATNDQYGTLTLDELCTLSAADLKKRGVNLSSLATYKSDRYTLNSCLDTFKTLAEKSSSQTVYWNDIRVAMNQLVDINSTTLQVVGSSDAPIPVGSLSMGNATKFSDETSYAVIQKGLIRNFEKRTGALMSILDVSKRTASASVKATVGFITQTVTITAIVSTNAAVPYDFGKDYTEALNNDSGFAGGDRVAQDTYGLAVDFWLRTNAASTYIKLEGATLTSKKEEQVKDFQGNEIWTATATIDGEEVTHDLIKDEDGNRWLLADGGDDVTDTIIDYGITPVKKMEVTETVIGYEGENRVWQDLNLSPNATTQGSGSCYVFYADTPQDQAQSLKLLGSMKVAFIDQNGVKLATAKMDTDHFYADSGRVTVPMVLDETDSVLSGSDIEGKPIRAITQINKRSPIRITALVYLSGSSLTNDMVLSSSNIEGQLNIQFGSTEQLFPIEDETLEDDTISVTATVDRTSFDYEKDAANMVANVDVTVEGFEPETVEAFFVRKINATQGTRQETMVFTKNDLSRAATGNGSTWHASQTFTMPGIYVLRNVRIDGVDYPVKDAVTVTIDGFDVQSLTCRDTYLFTSEKRASTALTLRFSASDDKLLPKKSVQGVFINENNVSTTVSFKKNPASHDYLGTADFVTSGMYRLQYLILDGETYELPEAMWKNVEVYIGLSAIVDLDRTNPENAITEFEFNKELGGGKTVALMVKIVDDSGNEITGMTGTRLYYKMSGSIKTLAEDLVWDSDMQAYKGNFIVRGAGIYSFKNLTVGSNNITYASRSFIIKATSPEPPAYHSAEKTKDYQFAPKENAEFILDITNSVAIDAKAVIVSVNDPTKSETVKGSIVEASTVDLGNGTVSSWSFLIPGEGKEDSITQDGEWQVKAIHLSGFTFENENGNQVSYTEDSPLVIDLSSNNIVTKVVCTYNIKVTGEDQEFIGDFMTKQNVANERATIVIEDYEHEPIPGVGNVQLVYDISDHNYSLNSDNYKKYGYTYTGNGYNEGLAKKTVTCTATGDGKTFVADTFELQ